MDMSRNCNSSNGMPTLYGIATKQSNEYFTLYQKQPESSSSYEHLLGATVRDQYTRQ